MTSALDAEGWDRLYGEKEWALSLEPNAILVELVSSLNAGRALDLGSGEGRNTVWLAQRGWRVTAVDFSCVAIEKAQRRAERCGLEPEFVVADLNDFRPVPGAYDLVLSAYVHPEAAQRTAMFAMAAEAVAPAGHLLVVGLDLAGVRPGRSERTEPERRYTPGRLSGAFPGIELVRCESVTREVGTAEGRAEAVDTLVWGFRQDGQDGGVERLSGSLANKLPESPTRVRVNLA